MSVGQNHKSQTKTNSSYNQCIKVKFLLVVDGRLGGRGQAMPKPARGRHKKCISTPSTRYSEYSGVPGTITRRTQVRSSGSESKFLLVRRVVEDEKGIPLSVRFDRRNKESKVTS